MSAGSQVDNVAVVIPARNEADRIRQTVTASAGLPFTAIGAMMRRPQVRRVLAIDFVYWLAFAVFQTTFALFVAHRFGFDAGQTGYFFAAFGVLGADCIAICSGWPMRNRCGTVSTNVFSTE